jgi:hypothetical protein
MKFSINRGFFLELCLIIQISKCFSTCVLIKLCYFKCFFYNFNMKILKNSLFISIVY